MSLKTLYCDSQDMNFHPDSLKRWKRDEVGRDYFRMKSSELFRLALFWASLLAVFAFIGFSFLDPFFILLGGGIFFFMIQCHFKYLVSWSKWNKFARRSVVRMDLDKDCRIVTGPKVPWVKLQGTRRGI